MSTTSSHIAPPKVTIASRPQTANATKLSNHPVPATNHTSTSLFAAPTRPPPPSVRPKSSSSNASSTTTARRSGVQAAAHSAIVSPRSRPPLSARRAHENISEGASVRLLPASPTLSSSTADTTGNVYHAMAARKSAEDTAMQLARRIAHFRAQEERVLREVQNVKSKLESTLIVALQSERGQQQRGDDKAAALWPAIGSPNCRPLQGWAEKNGAAAQSRREPKVPRSREQLQFLTKQKKVLQMRKLESAKHQKEKRKVTMQCTMLYPPLALDKQKLKEEADRHRKVVQKDKIRHEYQRALNHRATKQHELLESLEEQHEERLYAEKEREDRALDLVEQLREEERHVALRLQALKFHQEFIERGLCE